MPSPTATDAPGVPVPIPSPTTLPAGCENLSASNAHDFASTTRSSEFPSGVSKSLADCLALCCATADCFLFAWLDDGSAGGGM